MTTVAEQLASTAAGVAYLVQLDFSFGTVRWTSWGHNVDWAGHTWQGLGSLLAVGQAQASEALQFPPMELTMNLTNPAHLALAMGEVHTYRGKPVAIWVQVLDDELRALGDPRPFWAGLMDQVLLKTGDGADDKGQVAMRCEQPGRDGRAAQSLRLNHAQQQARHPGDTGLSRVEQLTGQPAVWLSKRFQRI